MVNYVLSVVVGVALGLASIYTARRVHGESWLYSATVLLLPLIYAAFATIAGDFSTATQELLVGLPFILGGLLCLVIKVPTTATFLGLLWVVHVLFDVSHNLLVNNPAVPVWYPWFCASIDLVIGVYVLQIGRSRRQGRKRQADVTWY